MKPIAHGSEMNAHLTAREVEITGRRYCTSCDSLCPPEGGEKSRYRWSCAACVTRKNERIKSLTLGSKSRA